MVKILVTVTGSQGSYLKKKINGQNQAYKKVNFKGKTAMSY